MTPWDASAAPAPADGATAVVAAATRLLEELAGERHPLRAVGDVLAGLASALGVERAVVAIDDGCYGRQVFCSGRRPLGIDTDESLRGPAGLTTEPPRGVDAQLARLVVAAVAAAFARAHHEAAGPAGQAPAARPAPVEAVASPPAVATAAGDLLACLRAATDRSARYGWGFTLVMVRFDDPDPGAAAAFAAELRPGDTLVDAGDGELALLLPNAAGDSVPHILARVARGRRVSAFSYGLAACPGDGAEPGGLALLAADRLRGAAASRPAPEIPATAPPKV